MAIEGSHTVGDAVGAAIDQTMLRSQPLVIVARCESRAANYRPEESTLV
ncbi:hypothetical protein AVDCRST_MAG94-3039 [uncultured Leptolyngbya sp.]|uniref:Uncharacterized protein n=1 Tax=uncultured Leptolyngbya sp. TaxID=332963 RepID=A0A6J4MHF5_9CYAN|nr:hypothetical protein AVDCRST_MAG94-3039 [uncultured Leptolyngbya sp.]